MISNRFVALALVGMILCSGCSKSKRPHFTDPLGEIKTTLGMFEVDNGRYPTTTEGLKALLEKPNDSSITNWHGPYLKANELKDPWGHEYVYRCPGIHNTAGYDLYSVGPDGKSDTADDIGNRK